MADTAKEGCCGESSPACRNPDQKNKDDTDGEEECDVLTIDIPSTSSSEEEFEDVDEATVRDSDHTLGSKAGATGSVTIIEAKEELAVVKEIQEQTSIHHFTEDEDRCLLKGLRKYGWGNWLKILGFREYRFHPYRSGECLSIRAAKLNMQKKVTTT